MSSETAHTKVSEIFTWVVLLDPADAILIHLFGFLGQHSVLQVRSVETHGKPGTLERRGFSFGVQDYRYIITVQHEARTLVAVSYSAGCECLSEHGGWPLLSGPSWALEETSCAVHAASCNLGGNRGPTEGLKSAD